VNRCLVGPSNKGRKKNGKGFKLLWQTREKAVRHVGDCPQLDEDENSAPFGKVTLGTLTPLGLRGGKL